MNELVLVKSTDLNGVVLDCYVEPNQENTGDFWATREQIGRLLGYTEPNNAIRKIHKRNKERLDKFSTSVILTRVEGGREVSRGVMVYSFKGLLEICRYSNQPKADEIMDWLWEVADEIRRTGSYSTQARLSPKSFKDAEALIDRAFKCKTEADCQQVEALDKVFQGVYGYSVLKIAEIQLSAQPKPELPHKNRSTELWQHIVSTFVPNEWFSISELMETLSEIPVCSRQIRRYLATFVASKKLSRRGCHKGTEYRFL